MSWSSLSSTIRRTSNVLRHGASAQVIDYEQRFSSLTNLYDDLLSNLIRTDFDSSKPYETAKEFFGSSTVQFAGIDGTLYSRPLFDLVIFFGGAYASTGQVTFRERDKPRIQYDERLLEQAAGISSVVPIYINEIPDVDPSLQEDGQPLTEESIINNASIANWIMTFAEHFLAYKLASDTKRDIRIVLMDRSLSIERASLLYDTAKRELWSKTCNLVGYEVDDQPIDENDLTIARQCVCNPMLGLPPARSNYFLYAIVEAVRSKGALSEDEIRKEFGIDDEKRGKRLRRSLQRCVDLGILRESQARYTLNPKYESTSERVKKLTTMIGERFFSANTKDADTASVMKIVKQGKEHWLTTIDIAFLSLFTLHMLMEECWKNHKLLVGITKDTAARDFKSQVIPIMCNEGFLRARISHSEMEKLPNTDRMILQSASIFNSRKLSPPWSLIEYDSVFRTMVPDQKGRKGYVSGAIRNRMSLERIFLKTYVQLSQAKTDPMLRSNVLLIDRLVYPEFDYRPENRAAFMNEFGGAVEPVETILFRDKTVPNKLQDLTMNVLLGMAPQSIPEAFGHNKPLFVADKVAKWNYSQFKSVVDTTASWILNNHKLRKFIFYMSTFRERRASIEAARREP
jgi:hypothetical protein